MTDKSEQNYDNRALWDWESKYPHKAWFHIVVEAVYLCFLLGICFVGLLSVVLDRPILWFSRPESAAQDRYLLYILGGLLGGTLFDIKWLYRSVARGYWHRDRIPWRFLSPLLSAGFALAVAFAFEAGFSRQPSQEGSAGYAAIGFLVGYFSDHAVAKLTDIADIVFGAPGKRGDSPEKHND